MPFYRVLLDMLDQVCGTVTVATVTLRGPYCYLYTYILLVFIQGHILLAFNIRRLRFSLPYVATELNYAHLANA